MTGSRIPNATEDLVIGTQLHELCEILARGEQIKAIKLLIFWEDVTSVNEDESLTKDLLEIAESLYPAVHGLIERTASTGVGNGRLLTDEDGERLTRIQPLDKEAGESINQSELPEFCFRRDRGVWEIRFRKESTILPDNLKGLRNIQRLLEYPDPQIPMLALSLRELDFDAGKAEQSKQPVLDEGAMKSYKKKVKELQADKEKAERDGDDLVVQECDREIARITAELKEALGLHQRHRDLGKSDVRTLARRSVKKNLDRAILAIHRAGCSGLAEHLSTIKTEDDSLAYRPGYDISWSLS